MCKPVEVVDDDQLSFDDAVDDMLVMTALRSTRMMLAQSGVTELQPFVARYDRLIAERDR